jgi:very-short-patch-repair endonuclease
MEKNINLEKLCNSNDYKLCSNNDCERCYEKSFASHEKSLYWDYENNNNINPRNIFKNTNKKYYFKCGNCKHIFNIKIADINKKNNWCSYCSNPPKKLCNDNSCIICFNKSFASHKKALYWNYEKNNNINPRNIFKNANKKYYFDCKNCKHIFDLPLGAITGSHKSWCPYCSNPPKKLCNDNNCDICFEKSFASHEKALYWNYEKNNNINPRNVFKNSVQKYFFNCTTCNHYFDTNLNNINNKKWCPYCAIPSRKLCNNNKCKICYEKSFASHEMAKYWNVEKNNNINPRDVFNNANTKYYFNCDKCNHYFYIQLNSLNYITKSLYCPYCSDTLSKLCDNNDCKSCYDRSFASHEMAKYWNYEKNNNINPREVFKNTHTEYNFNCKKCNHNFAIQLSFLNRKYNNIYCPYCMNTQSELCDDNNCKLCLERSFASHEKALYWNYEKNNNISPRNIFKYSHVKYYFNCDKCQVCFKISLADISSKNIWCSICKNKTEKIVYDFLLLNNFDIKKEAKFEWSKNNDTNAYFRYDFCIEYYKLIIEIDGIQHFKNIIHWKNDYKENQSRDKYKMEIALNEGYSIIRILQEDIYKNKFDWKKELLENIKKKINPQIIYICKNNEYLEYEKL